MLYAIVSLIRNNPIPPLPKFFPNRRLTMKEPTKIEASGISESDIKIYTNLFFQNKDTKKDYMSEIKVIALLQQFNYGNITQINYVLEKLQPLEIQGFFNTKEFVAICYLLCKNKNAQNPNLNLFPYVLDYLGRNQKKVKKIDESSFENNNSTTVSEFSLYNKVLIENKININLKRTETLNKKYEQLNKKIKELYEEIGKFQKEQICITQELAMLKNEQNQLHQKLNKIKNIGYCDIKNNSNSNLQCNINKNIITKKEPNEIVDNNSASFYNFSRDLNNAYEKVKKFETYQPKMPFPKESNIESKIFESKEANINNCLVNANIVNSSVIEIYSKKK